MGSKAEKGQCRGQEMLGMRVTTVALIIAALILTAPLTPSHPLGEYAVKALLALPQSQTASFTFHPAVFVTDVSEC